MTDVKTVISADKISKSYNGIPVIKEISLSVREGDFLSVTGNSGAGKSTLLYLLAGIERPDSGSVCVDGKTLALLKPGELAAFRGARLGFVFQFDNLFPELTVAENITLPLAINGKAAKRGGPGAAELMDYFGITGIKDKRAALISGGEQQRASIARALIINPGIIILDEPTGSLNSEAGDTVIEYLKKINRELGATVIQATHNAANARAGNRLIHLKDGMITADD